VCSSPFLLREWRRVSESEQEKADTVVKARAGWVAAGALPPRLVAD
jgi:hypothetical protein